MTGQKEKIQLRKEQETCLITLYAKTVAAPKGIFKDDTAWSLLDKIDYDFSRLHISNGTRATMILRAKKIDELVRLFLERQPQGMVLHLGCGLDTRFQRVDNGLVTWYDLDLPDVIELRGKLFKSSDRYQMLASSAVEMAWMDAIQDRSKPVLVAAEGLMMYLHENEVRALIVNLRENFPACELVFDAYSTMTVRKVGSDRALKKTGAVVHWGIDNAREIESWAPGLRLKEEWYFSQSEDIAKMPLLFRIIFKLTGSIQAVQKAHRVLYFTD